MLLRLVFGACLFGLGYYAGRKAGLDEASAGRAANDETFDPVDEFENSGSGVADRDSKE